MPKGSPREATFAANRRLKEEYPERFRQLHAEELEKRGIPVPKSPEEKARATVNKLLAEYPQVVYDAVGEHHQAEVFPGSEDNDS